MAERKFAEAIPNTAPIPVQRDDPLPTVRSEACDGSDDIRLVEDILMHVPCGFMVERVDFLRGHGGLAATVPDELVLSRNPSNSCCVEVS